MDSAREMRAMTMAAFPCPPLPMEGLNSSYRESEINSHDFLAMLINTAALIGDTKADVARAKSQFTLTEAYLGAMRDTDRPLYTMQAFTRDYMATYGPILDVRFRQRGSANMTTQQHSWLRAQYILRDMEVKEVGDWLRETQLILLSTIIWSTRDANTTTGDGLESRLVLL
jgi:hypothetical protein